jgi:hypothetical protein
MPSKRPFISSPHATCFILQYRVHWILSDGSIIHALEGRSIEGRSRMPCPVTPASRSHWRLLSRDHPYDAMIPSILQKAC